MQSAFLSNSSLFVGLANGDSIVTAVQYNTETFSFSEEKQISASHVSFDQGYAYGFQVVDSSTLVVHCSSSSKTIKADSTIFAAGIDKVQFLSE